jgi:WD40 repeat protein/serine/threonine protein kinase
MSCLTRVVFTNETEDTPWAGESPADSVVGGKLGDYELLECIGRGGVGIVYRARQLSLGREVAVKVLLDSTFAGPEELARFRGEAIAAAGLDHPNIVAIHEVGEEGGQKFFSMDFVAGEDLAALTRQGPFSARRAAELVRKIAAAVQHSHERGILHRDLKPSNVLIDSLGEPHVTDFGLAKRIAPAPSESSGPLRGADADPSYPSSLAMTLSGQIIGTPGYMSPEQAAGRRGVGPETDIYSLGALLYHLLTARAPFAGETPTAVLRQVEEQEPVAPRLLNSSVPRDLETICLKCLAKEPSRRYARASALGDDLERFLEGKPIQARPTSPLGQAWRWCRRRPSLAAALGGIGLLLMVIAASSIVSAHHINYLRRVAYTNLYAADMRLALQAAVESKFGVAVDLLQRHRPNLSEPDLRGFEWYYLWDQCRSEEVATLGHHPAEAQRVAFSPDGRLVATAAADVNVWDVLSHRPLDHFAGEGFVRVLEFSTDSRHLAAAFQDALLVSRDVVEGREIGTITNLGMRPLAVSWNSSNSLSVFGAEQSLSWDTRSGLITKINGLGKGIQRLALTPNAHRAAAARTPFDLYVLDLLNSREIGQVRLSSPIYSLSISPDGRTVVTGDYSGNLEVRQISNLRESRPIKDHRGLITAQTFSADGTVLASGGVDQLIHVWHTTDWTLVNTLRGHLSAVFTLAISPDSRWVVSGEKTGEVKLWNLEGLKNEPATFGFGRGTLSADGSVLVCNDTNGIAVIPFAGGRALHWATQPPLESVPSSVSSNGFVLEDGLGHPYLLRPGPGGGRSELPECELRFLKAISPDGRYYVFCERAGNAPGVWDILEQRQLCRMTNAPAAPSAPAIAADNRHFAVGSSDGTAYVSDLRTGKAVANFQAHQGWCYACDFSRDGHRLVTAGFDGVVKLWETETGKKVAEFRSSADSYWSVALSPDGRRIAAGTGESTVVLWDVASRQEVATLSVTDPILPVEGHLRFSPDGTTLIFGGPAHWKIWLAPK